MRVAVGLADGRTLTVETAGELTARIWGLPSGFFAGIAGFVVAALAVLLLVRETRPLARLSRSVERFAAALQPGCRVIAFDQRGRGRSDWDPQQGYYTDAYVSDLAAVVDALGLERFDLLGHSMGGINAIVYAATHPSKVNRLLVEDAGPGAFEASPGATSARISWPSSPPAASKPLQSQATGCPVPRRASSMPRRPAMGVATMTRSWLAASAAGVEASAPARRSASGSENPGR